MGETERYRRVLLEVSDDDPIAGQIRPADGEPRPFSGWIGLAATLAAWLAEPEAPAEASPPPDPPRQSLG
jgi:hypothetical protein